MDLSSRLKFVTNRASHKVLSMIAWMCLLLVAGVAVNAQDKSPGTFSFAVASYDTIESAGTVLVTVIRTNGLDGKVSVDLSWVNSSLLLFTTNKGIITTNTGVGLTNVTLVFNDFQSSLQFPVQLIDNDVTNKANDVTFGLSNPKVAVGETFTNLPTIGALKLVKLKIQDNDAPMQFNFRSDVVYVSESGGDAQLIVELKDAPPSDATGPVSVDFTTEVTTKPLPGNDIALETLDYALTTGTLTFDAANRLATISVPIVNDQLIEFNEEFIVSLQNPQGSVNKGTAENPTNANFVLGNTRSARVVIQFNGIAPAPQPAGSVDQLFNADNDLSTTPVNNPNPGANDTVYGSAVSSKGKSVIVGTFSSVNGLQRNRVARLNADGSVDESFDPGLGANDFVSAVAIHKTGTLLDSAVIVGGFNSVGTSLQNSIARLSPSGDVDSGFDTGSGADGPIYTVSIDRSNRILIGGDFSLFNGEPHNRVVRLLPDGSIDRSFDLGDGPNGTVYTLLDMAFDPITVLANYLTNAPPEYTTIVDTGSKSGSVELVYDFGLTPDFLRVYSGTNRIFDSGLTNRVTISTNLDGTIQTNTFPITNSFVFGPANTTKLKFVVNEGNTNDDVSFVFAATIQPAGNPGVFLGGDFTLVGTNKANRIARVSREGVVDAPFSSGAGADNSVYALAAGLEGTIYAGGAFQKFNSRIRPYLVHVLTNGTVDTSFATGTGPDGAVQAIAVDAAREVYVGGGFLNYNGSRRVNLARILPTGVLDTSFLDTAYNQYAGFPDVDGFAPRGVLLSITTTPDGGVLVGGLFQAVGGGNTRAAIHPRSNFAKLVGGSTDGPGSVEFVASTFSASEGGARLPFSLSRTGGSLGDLSAAITTTDASALKGIDYVDFVGSAFWSNKVSSNYLSSVSVTDDKIIEGDEEFSLLIGALSASIGLGGEPIITIPAYAGHTSAIATIIDDDKSGSTIGFSLTEYEVNEGDGFATINVYRTGNISGSFSVKYATSGGTVAGRATPGDDFTMVSGTLNFKNGETNHSFIIPIRDDFIVEPDETIAVSLSGLLGTGAVLGANSNAVVTIIDNDFQPGVISFSTTTNSVAESAGKVVVIAKRLGGSRGIVQAEFFTQDITASAGADYQAINGLVVWNDGDTLPKTIEIPIVNDGIVEGPESFSISLTNASPLGALGSKTNEIVTILDEDAFGKLQFNTTALYSDENGLNAIVQVVRRDGVSGTVSVDYAATATTAISGKDFQPVNGTLVFGPGEVMRSFIVPILDDTIADGDRLVSLRLSKATNAALGLPIAITLTIIDNETKNIPAGGVDTDFAAGGGANGVVYDIKPQANGSIYIGGDFTQVNGDEQSRVAKLNKDGSLNYSFAPDLSVNASVHVLGVSPTSGKILPGGAFTAVSTVPYRFLARLSSLGSLDTSFNPGSGTDSQVLAIVEVIVAGERKTLIGGGFSSFNGFASRGLARVNDNGTADKTFNTGGGVNGTVYAILIQRDSKIVIGGDFLSVGGVSIRNIARLNADGSVDTTFNIPSQGVDDVVRALALQDDDSIILGGSFHTVSGAPANGIARLLPNGAFDSSFIGLPGANGPVFAMAIQPDGAILVGGDFNSFHGLGINRLVRLGFDGNVDPSINFGTGPNAYVSSIALEANRRILIGGGFTEVNGIPRAHLAALYGGSIVGNGQIEFTAANYSVTENVGTALVTIRRVGGTMGSVGVILTTSGLSAVNGSDYSDLSTNLIFAEGETFKTVAVTIINNDIADLDRTVSLSLSQVTGGATVGDQPFAVLTIQNDDTEVGFNRGSYSVGEVAVGGGALITVERKGLISLPLTVDYFTSGQTASPGSDYTDVSGSLFFPKGVRTATFTIPIIDDLIIEGTETVSLNLSVNGGGSVILKPASATLSIIDDDFAPGELNFRSSLFTVDEGAGTAAVVVERLNGKSGLVTVEYSVSPISASEGTDYTPVSGQLVFQDNVASATISIPIIQDLIRESTEYLSVQLRNVTGGATLGISDTTVAIRDDDFGPGSFDRNYSVGNGAFNNATGLQGSVRSLAILADQRVLVGGDFDTFGNVSSYDVARVLPNGTADSIFRNQTFLGGSVFSISPRPANGLYIAGDFTGSDAVLQYVGLLSSNGVYNTAFKKNAGLNGKILAAVCQPDGKLIVGGSFTFPVRHLARLTAEGGLDVSFNVEGGTDGDVSALLLQPDGSVLVGGTFTKLGSDTAMSLARVSKFGVFDTTFTNSAVTASVGVPGSVYAIARQNDGRILIGGEFASVGGVARSRLARLKATGGVDTTFLGATPPKGTVRAIAIDSAGKVVIGGDFLQCGNVDRVRVARYNPDGTLDTNFDPGTGPDDSVFALGIQVDGQILLGGSFFTVNSFVSPGLARLDGDPVATLLPFNITAAKLLANQSLRITFDSIAGRKYTLQASSNFSQWADVTDATATGSSTDLVGPPSDTNNYRFYRVITR